MNCQEKIELIQTRLREAFKPTLLEVIDESDQHAGHAGHQGGGRHFHIKISAERLSQLTKVAAHRRIYAVLSDLLPSEIHALRITILNS